MENQREENSKEEMPNLESLSLNEKNSWDPENTFAYIISILEWKKSTLAGWDKPTRKDKDLYETLLSRGVKKENIIYIMDQDATINNLQENLKEILKKTTPESTFLFYYAGHGGKSKINIGEGLFLAYDHISEEENLYNFSTNIIGEYIKNYFNGKKVILTADCCYSGTLNNIADFLKPFNIDTLVLASVVSTNSSTGSWTFTISLFEILAGKALVQEIEINLKSAKEYIMKNMKFEAKQIANIYYCGTHFNEDFILSKSIYKVQERVGEFKRILSSDKYYLVRIIGEENGKYKLDYCGYKHVSMDSLVDYSDLVDLEEEKIYPIGTKVKVLWCEKWYDAVILKVQEYFHFIKYVGWDDSYNEWVTPDVIKVE